MYYLDQEIHSRASFGVDIYIKRNRGSTHVHGLLTLLGQVIRIGGMMQGRKLAHRRRWRRVEVIYLTCYLLPDL
jgi:hypothetical protein